MSKIDYYNKRCRSLRERINVLQTLLDEVEQRLHAEETIETLSDPEGVTTSEAGNGPEGAVVVKLVNRLRAEMNVGGYKRGIYAQIVIKHCEKMLKRKGGSGGTR